MRVRHDLRWLTRSAKDWRLWTRLPVWDPRQGWQGHPDDHHGDGILAPWELLTGFPVFEKRKRRQLWRRQNCPTFGLQWEEVKR